MKIWSNKACFVLVRSKPALTLQLERYFLGSNLMSDPILAAQLYTVRDFTQTATGLVASLAKIRAIGYSAVQVSAIGPISDQEVKSMVTDQGLTICNSHVRPAEALWDNLDAVIAQHHLWGCRHVAIGSMPATYREAGEAGYHRFAIEANRIGEKLHQAGLTFSYHNHSFEFVRFGSRTGLEIIYAESDPRYVQAELDTYWVQHGGGDPAAWIERLADRMPVIHLKDMAIVEGQQVMAEVGEGNMNWPAILAACQAAGVEWYAVEQDICRRDPFASLALSYKNLQEMGLS
jgi:sugar phosphate isomerase/epimerase